MDVIEQEFVCPYCWQKVAVWVDASIAKQEYIEDCELCCKPVVIKVASAEGAISAFEAERS